MVRLQSASRWRWPICLGAGVAVAISHQSKHHRVYLLDSRTTTRGQATPATRPYFPAPDPGLIKDVSRGSICGFGAGLVVGFFSQALAVVAGLTMFTLHMLQRWGLDIPRLVGAKDILSKAVLDKPLGHAVFRLTFALTFTLAAFVRF